MQSGSGTATRIGRAMVVLGIALAGCGIEPASRALPRVHLIGTGGTIAAGPTGPLTAADLVDVVPDIRQIANVRTEDFSQIASSGMTPEIQFRLARHISELLRADPEMAGVVVTHGTDSLEETAFLLDLLLDDPRPVVVTGALRPPGDPRSDAPAALLSAVRVASAPDIRNAGILVVIGREIHAAREVRKAHTSALDAFESPRVGPAGRVERGRLAWHRQPRRRLTIPAARIEPRVALITLGAGSDGSLVRAAADAGVQGLVLEVFGRGHVPPEVMEAVREARERGLVIVFASRTRGGAVTIGDEARRLGVVSAEDVDGLKARTLLVVALGVTHDPAAIQTWFRALAGA